MLENETVNKYYECKSQLSTQLAELQTVLLRNGTTNLRTECTRLYEKLQVGHFNLVVMGQFKRGKSTFINALLGNELLPTAVVPLTSVVTTVRFGSTARAQVHFFNGQRLEISLHQLAEYTTERKNPQNAKQVDKVEIEFPAEFLRDGVLLIDTPGVGSVFGHNTDTAYEFLPQADAVLFLVTADPPISESELKFLADVREHASKIFFIKNKIDHLSSQELHESLTFTREVLANELQLDQSKIKIFPISAKWALQGRLQGNSEMLRQSLLQDVERTLREFLMNEKGAVLLQNIQRRAQILLQEADNLLELEIKAMITPQSELEEKMRAFQQHQKEIQQQKDVLMHLLDGGVKSIFQRYDDEVEQLKKTKLTELENNLRSFFGKISKKDSKQLATDLEQALLKQLDALFGLWRKQQEQKVNSEFVSLAQRLTTQVNAAIDRIYQIAGELFALHLQRYEREEQLAEERYFSFNYDVAPTTLDDFEKLFTFTFATLISKKIILNKILERLLPLFDRQCGRVRADFYDRLRESSFTLQRRLTDRMDDAYAEIQLLIERARQRHDAGAMSIAQHLEDLQQSRQHLTVIKEKLHRLEYHVSFEKETSTA